MSNTRRRRDENVDLRRVGGVNTPPTRGVNTPVGSVVTQFTISCAADY